METVCRTRSLREAAKILCLHHSSVAHRVARAERALGISLSDPAQRQRAYTALLLWRLNARTTGATDTSLRRASHRSRVLKQSLRNVLASLPRTPFRSRPVATPVRIPALEALHAPCRLYPRLGNLHPRHIGVHALRPAPQSGR
ncbi:helix-turn-helix domain-containing protein [Streptomyces nogalater]